MHAANKVVQAGPNKPLPSYALQQQRIEGHDDQEMITHMTQKKIDIDKTTKKTD